MRLGLVLAGGGSKGAFEAGVVAAMERRGLVAQVLSGTSAGALNAAGLAAGFDAARLGDIWRQVGSADVYRLRRDLWNLPRPRGLASRGSFADRLLSSIGWTYLLKTDPLRRTLMGVLGGEPIPVVAGRTLVVSAVERDSGALVRFASAAPPAHRPLPGGPAHRRPPHGVRGDPPGVRTRQRRLDRLLGRRAGRQHPAPPGAGLRAGRRRGRDHVDAHPSRAGAAQPQPGDQPAARRRARLLPRIRPGPREGRARAVPGR